MNSMLNIYRRELSNFFNSPMAYITLVVFLLIGGWFFTSTFFLINESDLRNLFGVIPIVYIFFIPAITMSLIAKERSDNTMEFLTTLPIREIDIVVGKWLAAVTLIAVALAFTLVHFVTLLFVGTNVDVGALASGYLGLLLVGAVYAAVGTFGSSVTDNQITAFIVSFLIIFLFFIVDKFLFFVPGFMTSFLQYLSIDYHLSNISRGVIDSRNLIYFISATAFFLLISTRILEMRKWR